MVEEQVLTRDGRVDQLRRLCKTDPDPRVRRRAHGVLLVEQGHTLAEVARFFGTAPHRVRAWQDRFVAEGRAGLADRARGGRPPKLDQAALTFVSAALDCGPQAYGFPVTVWTLGDLQTLLLRERQVQVSVATLYRVVHTLGYTYGRPRHDLRHRQDAEAVATAKRVLDWLQKKRLLSEDDPIWSTWTSVKSTPTPTRAMVWRRKGQPLRVPAAGEDHKFVVFGAVEYASGQVVHQLSAQKGEVAFVAFLEHLVQALQATADDPLIVVLDNAGYHKSHELRAWWQQHADHVQPFWLPAYAPQLNRIERLWRHLKDKLACHRWWNAMDRLQQATAGLLAALEVHFHATNDPAFRPVHNFCQPA